MTTANESLVEWLKLRSDLGQRKYGTKLKTNNGRTAIVDALEEALDLTQYLMQVYLEQTEDGEVEVTQALIDLVTREKSETEVETLVDVLQEALFLGGKLMGMILEKKE